MKFTSPGKLASADEMRAALQAIDESLGCDSELLGADGPLGRSIEIDGRRIGNRFAVHPMEGWDAAADGMPSEHTLRRWRRFGQSGAKLIWGGEAFAVQPDGRANPRQLCLHPGADSEAGLTALLAALQQAHRDAGFSTDDLLTGLQLTHSGRFCDPTAAGRAPRIAFHHPVLEERYPLDPSIKVLTDAELESIAESFIRAARLAERVGFGFVDVKCCHGYLLHELLAARSREGKYGGSFENRTRLFVSIVNGIRSACPNLMIAVRVSITDLYPHDADPDTGEGAPLGMDANIPYRDGFGIDPQSPLNPDFDEPIKFLDLLRSLDIKLVNITIGSPYWCPHIQRPAAYPPSDGYLPPEDPLCGVAAHLKAVRICKQALADLILLGSGYSYLQGYLPNVAQYEIGRGHVDFVGLGRMILSYPEMPADVLRGAALDRKRICRTFSDCTTGPRHGIISGCYPLDEHYRNSPEAKRVYKLRRRPV